MKEMYCGQLGIDEAVYNYGNNVLENLKERFEAIDEVADVEIILHHVKAIFNLNQEEIDARNVAKTERLQRWLDNSPSMQRTIEDRTVNMN